MQTNEYPEKEIWEKAREQAEALLDQLPEVKDPYLLRVWGAAKTYPEFANRYGQPNEMSAMENPRVYAFWFETDKARKEFKQQMIEFCKTLPNSTLVYDMAEPGPLVKKNVIVHVTLRYQGKEYEVKKSYGYGYPLSTVIFDWEENNTSCDCNRLLILDHFHPGVLTGEDDAEDRRCSDGVVVVTAFQFKLLD